MVVEDDEPDDTNTKAEAEGESGEFDAGSTGC
jgi:hypothetical protein